MGGSPREISKGGFIIRFCSQALTSTYSLALEFESASARPTDGITDVIVSVERTLASCPNPNPTNVSMLWVTTGRVDPTLTLLMFAYSGSLLDIQPPIDADVE